MCFWEEGSRVSQTYCFSTRGSHRSCQNRCHEKLAASSDPKEPSSVFGTVGYYHKFVKDYGKIAAPLTALLKNDVFSWTLVAECSFEKLKQAMCTTPVLAMPVFPSPSLLRVMLATMDLVLSSFKMNIPFRSPVNHFLIRI